MPSASYSEKEDLREHLRSYKNPGGAKDRSRNTLSLGVPEVLCEYQSDVEAFSIINAKTKKDISLTELQNALGTEYENFTCKKRDCNPLQTCRRHETYVCSAGANCGSGSEGKYIIQYGECENSYKKISKLVAVVAAIAFVIYQVYRNNT